MVGKAARGLAKAWQVIIDDDPSLHIPGLSSTQSCFERCGEMPHAIPHAISCSVVYLSTAVSTPLEGAIARG